MTIKELPSVVRLREVLRYEPETGKLIWLPRAEEEFSLPQYAVAWNTRFAGIEAGYLTNKGHRIVGVDRGLFFAHRIIWAMVHGAAPVLEIDHIDQNPDNNRVNNLREVSHLTNLMNVSMRRDNVSGCMGVTQKASGRWRANIQADKKWRYLGTFDSFEEAVQARKQAAEKFGFSANHGRAKA